MNISIEDLISARIDDKPRILVQYCRHWINTAEAGITGFNEAAYNIAQAMFIPGLDSEEFDKIMTLAGSLELPAHVTGGDQVEQWKQLKNALLRYEKIKSS